MGTLAAILGLVARGNYRVSDHAYEEMAKDDIMPSQIVSGLESALVVEDYPDANRGPSVLVLCSDGNEHPLHAVWGIPKQRPDMAVLVTAYRPDPEVGSDDFLMRKKK
jgi:hypothetical protein